MEDTSSIASFEDITPPTDRVRDELVADTSSSADLVDDEVPDICYVLQSKEVGKALVEVRRGPKPIDPDLGEFLDEDAEKNKKKSVLEIVTLVSTSLVSNQLDYNIHPTYGPGLTYGPGGAYIPDMCYGHHPSQGGHRQPHPNDEDDSDKQIARSVNTVMVIRSQHLINALAAVVSYYPGTSFTGDEVKIAAPYYVLVHHRAALLRYKTSQPETHDEEYAATTSKHIDLLVGFLEQTYGRQIREEGMRHSRKIPTVTYEWLWLLLRPGEVIYTQHDSAWSPFVISRVSKKSSPNEDGLRSYSIDCWNYMYQNKKLRRTMHTFKINPFSGEEAIRNLTIIPARFFTGEDQNMSPSAVTAEQVRLGKVVWELYKKPSYKSYDGDLAKKTATRHVSDNACLTGSISGRVIIDGEGFERYWPDCPLRNQRLGFHDFNAARLVPPTPFDQLPYLASYCGCRACDKPERSDELSPFAVFQDLDPRHDKAPEDDLYYHVISKVIAGFILSERRWGQFHVEKLRDIRFDREAFKYLVLDYEIKSTVKALVGKFASADGRVSAWPKDFVKNKGQGRIFLLHGSPGVGKTCTAECVAELTHRPLLALTSGDLSTKTHLVERDLDYFMTLGERFGAIVLLDEADVFLERRRVKNISRNGLVSVFLRALEYYRGVLFLTTNRVQTFDDAFTSRIHVALHYGPLTDADRERIWLQSFERLERDAAGRVHVAVAAREYAWQSADVRALRWNGREIRNALQTAVALAETDAVEEDAEVVVLTDKHLRAVVRMSRGFKNFMRRERSRIVEREDEDEDEEEEEEEEEEVEEENEIVLYEDDDDETVDNAEYMNRCC
ncbi:P-loop containing nucleoside triphosphate hydrolase protein [Xylaria venustula]|nr:P-loop containing nucleoside triphosphate hydrolase protein [Xylaria venustula]